MEYIDIQEELGRIRARGADIGSNTVLKTATLRLVLMALRSGAILPQHHTDGRTSVQVLEGEVEFSAGDESRRLRPGTIVALEARVPHALAAVSDAVLLLSIAWPTMESAAEQAEFAAHRKVGYE